MLNPTYTLMLKNDIFLKALNREPVSRTPIWIMRQAGRYLPEYREVRAEITDFMALCRNPELCAKVAMQPLERFDLDAAILFSDILTIPDAMGLGLRFEEGEGPVFDKPIRRTADVDKLGVPDPEGELRYVMDAVRHIRKALGNSLPLIGFSGSPWTLSTYMIEGQSSKTFSKCKAMLYTNPELMHRLLQTLTDSVIKYLNAQIEAGVDVVMLFDTWGGILTPEAYQAFSLDYMAQIVDGVKSERDGQKVPIILFTKNGGQNLSAIADSGCTGIGLDWTTDIALARELVGDKVAIQGNMDPCILYASPERIQNEVKKIKQAFGDNPGHIFNLGHGIYPDTPPENVDVLVDAVHQAL